MQSRELSTELHDNERKRSAASAPKFWNRKFLRQGTFRNSVPEVEGMVLYVSAQSSQERTELLSNES